jgi:polysaccharide export outer membrane protein
MERAMSKRLSFLLFCGLGLAAAAAAPAAAQQQQCQSVAPPEPANGPAQENGSSAAAASVGTRASFLFEHPPDYVIGADDMLSIRFWREDPMNADVVVRPDGKITLPLINDIQAAGLTPIALCNAITDAAKRWLETPTVSVIVKEIKSRKVFITGQVNKPGPYEMSGQMTVLHLITLAGGLAEFADAKNITVIRSENGKQLSYRVNFDDISRGRNLAQNIALRPGDSVIVR